MSIRLGAYDFEGPYPTVEHLQDRSGVYAILCGPSGSATIADIGESALVKSRVIVHDRKPCWNRHCASGVTYAVLYTSETQRMAIEQQLRAQYRPPCGRR